MNREQYLEFLRLNGEVNERVRKICAYVNREGDSNYLSVDSIDFEEDEVRFSYSGSNSLEGIMLLPSEFLFTDDWKNKYDSWAEKQRQEAKRRELEENRIRGENERNARYLLFQKLKAEFDN